MRENHVLRFFVSRNLSSLRLTGYIEFVVLLYASTVEITPKSMTEANNVNNMYCFFKCYPSLI